MTDDLEQGALGTGRRSTEDRNALVLAANEDGIFDADLLTGECFCSPEWFAQIGYLPGELPVNATSWHERIHPEDRPIVEDALTDYLARRKPSYRVDFRIRHRDGHWCWLQVRAKAVWDEQGVPLRLVGSHRDITDRKNAEVELQASEARLRISEASSGASDLSTLVDDTFDVVSGKQIALICENEEAAASLLSHFAGAGLSVARYARAPQSGRLAADLVIVDSSAIAKPTVAAQFFNTINSPVVILGTPKDFSFPLPCGRLAVTYLSKPVWRLALLHTVQAIFDASPADQSPDSYAQGTDVPFCTECARVLLAEDNRVNQLVTRILLERMGCRVDIVENGLAACRAVQNGTYDVVLMDCQMPLMSGFEATRRIRSLESGGHRTPIIALTTGAIHKEKDLCYASGMDDFVSKPISAKELEKALDRWLAKPAKAD